MKGEKRGETNVRLWIPRTGRPNVIARRFTALWSQ